MREVMLDGRAMAEAGAAHGYLAERLGFPGYYGRNLDALFDCLGDIGEATVVTVAHAEAMLATADGLRIWRVMEEAAGANPFLAVRRAGEETSAWGGSEGP